MSQLMSSATNAEAGQHDEPSGPPAANRHRLPDERAGITHHFSIAGHEGYLTVGLYPNGHPGEIFIRMAKEGSTIAGLMECFGTVVSVSTQHGVPLKGLCDKLSHTRFEPSGWTGNEELGHADGHQHPQNSRQEGRPGHEVTDEKTIEPVKDEGDVHTPEVSFESLQREPEQVEERREPSEVPIHRLQELAEQ